jgi:hypothetical protein
VVTKLKTLAELSAAVASRPKPVVKDLLPAWSVAYTGLALHNDHRVRVGAHRLLDDVVAAGMRKSFGPHLPKMLPYWWACMHDPAREVAASATAAWERMFPGRGRQLEAAVAYPRELALGLLQLVQQGPEELSDMRVTTVRVTAMNKGALARLGYVW